MTLYEFNLLDEMEQIEVLWEASIVAEREDEANRIFLYQIDSFYVEAYQSKEHGLFQRLRSFSSLNQLEPYLNSINISSLPLD